MDIQKSASMIAILSSVCIFSFFIVSFLNIVDPLDLTDETEVQDESPIGNKIKISSVEFKENLDQELQNKLLDYISEVTSQNEVLDYSAAIVLPQTNEIKASFNPTYSYKFGNVVLPLIYAFLIEQRELSPGSKLSNEQSLREGLKNHILTKELKTIIETDDDFMKLVKDLSIPGNVESLLAQNHNLPFESLLHFYSILASQKSFDLLSSQSSFVVNDYISLNGIASFSTINVEMVSTITSISYTNEHLVFMVFEINNVEDDNINNIRRLSAKILESINSDNKHITKPDGVIQSEYCNTSGQLKNPEDNCESYLEWNITENY